MSGAAGWAGLAAWSWEPAGAGDGDWERLGGRGLLERERERDLICNVVCNVIICHNMIKLIKYAAVTERSQYSDDLVTAGCRSPAVQGDTAGSRGRYGDGGHTGNMKWRSISMLINTIYDVHFTD